MDISVVEKKTNPLLERDEITFRVMHTGEATPSLAKVRDVLRAELNSKAELTVVDAIYSHFGSGESSGFAKIYKSKEQLDRIEAKHIKAKNLGRKEQGEQKEEAQEEEKAPEEG